MQPNDNADDSGQNSVPQHLPISQLNEQFFVAKGKKQSKPKPNVDTRPQNAGDAPKTPLIDRLVIGLLVVLQFTALLVIMFAFWPALLWQNGIALLAGIGLLVGGLVLGGWAVLSFNQMVKVTPSPNASGFLVTGGPYKYVRHPMYLGLIMVSLGITLAFPTVPRLFALLVLVLVLNIKLNIEEELLRARYHHYDRYQKVSGKILPKFKKPDVSQESYRQ